MKKLLAIIFIAVLSTVMLTGCKSEKETAEELILGRWECFAYAEESNGKVIDDKYNDYTPVEFYADGTMKYIVTGASDEWMFMEDSEYSENHYCYSVGDEEKIFLIAKDDTSILHYYHPYTSYASQNWFLKKVK